MYKLTRQEAATELNMSTRSIDRYIKSGKLRSKKQGKIVYIHSQDIENMLGKGESKQEVIINNISSKKEKKEEKEVKSLTKKDNSAKGTLNLIYKDLKEDIDKKDQIIRDLSIRVGKAEEIASNSIPVMEYKKSQFLLEESKSFLNKEIEELEKDKDKLKQELNYEKNSNKLLIIFLVILLLLASIIWFIKI